METLSGRIASIIGRGCVRVISNSERRLFRMERKLVVLVVLALMLIMHLGDAQGMDDQPFKELLDAQWENLEKPGSPGAVPTVLWSYRVSPPFPSKWPPESKRSFHYYVYGYGFDLKRGLADAVLMAAPWAKVEVVCQRGIPLKVEVLSKRIREIGIQGVRPLSAEEIKVYDRRKEMEDYFFSLDAMPTETRQETRWLKQYYRTWVGGNGVLVQEIQYRHKSFFEWLGFQ